MINMLQKIEFKVGKREDSNLIDKRDRKVNTMMTWRMTNTLQLLPA